MLEKESEHTARVPADNPCTVAPPDANDQNYTDQNLARCGFEKAKSDTKTWLVRLSLSRNVAFEKPKSECVV